MYEKLDKKNPPRPTNAFILGQTMQDASQDIGPGTAYGKFAEWWGWESIEHRLFVKGMIFKLKAGRFFQFWIILHHEAFCLSRLLNFRNEF